MKQTILYLSTQAVAIGLTLWFILLGFHSLSFLEWLFLFAPLVIVPLGSTLLDNGRLPIFLTLPSTLLLVLAFLLPKGVTAVLPLFPLSPAPLLPRSPARLLLTLSALAILIGMSLALLYALSQITHTVLIPIPHMIRSHGLLNAFGFAFCGLWGWHLSR